ncbi:ABC transporter permease [Roseitranquillus sediminis]|uniref:ABC transporter permease n=1 Tax=Roseitranquillus sediminis TaxID=2809051 RepID=UPI001D0C2875|nr:ABC transporter permease [Roseitranquillus sediminis]MBM9595955.1 ABC transporter permease [Roseitranquillus sediminis]
MIVAFRVGFLILLIGLWQVLSQNVSRNLIPSPLETWAAFRRMLADNSLFEALGESLVVYLSGYSTACIVAIAIGLVMGTIRPVGKTLEVYAFALAATPRVAFIPLIIVFLGLGFEAKVFVVFLGAVMPILVNTYAGVLATDQNLNEMARSLGVSRPRIFASIVLPGAVPFIVVGLRIGATIGLINTVVAELYTAVGGLGGLLARYGNTFRMADYFVIVLSLAAIGVAVTETLRYLELRLNRWRGPN